jgi:hypothetical protein
VPLISVMQPNWGPDRVLRDPLRVSDNRIRNIWGKWAMTKGLADLGEAVLVTVAVISLAVVIGLPAVDEWRRRRRK